VTTGRDRREPLVVAGILLGAAALRVLYLLVYARALPFLPSPTGDSAMYLAWARHLTGSDYSGPFYRAPLYPHLLSGLLALSGQRLVPVCGLQLVLGLATVLLVYLIARRVFGRSPAVVALVLTALCGPLAFFETKLLAATLVVFLTVLGTWLLTGAGGRRAALRWLGAGASFGLAALSWGGAGVVFAVVVVAAVLLRQASWRAALAGIAGCAALVSVATVRNAVAGHDFVSVSYNSGFTFYQGNNRLAVGTLAQPPEVYESGQVVGVAEQERFEREYVGRMLGREARPSEVSAFWSRRALSWIAGYPGSFLVLLGRKLVLALADYESPSDENYELELRHVWPLRLLGVRFALLLALAVAAAVMLRPRAAWALYGLFAGGLATLLVFYVTDRYRLPAYPALVVLAGAGAVELWRRARSRRLGPWPLVAGGATLLFSLGTGLPLRRGSDLLLANSYRNLGDVYARIGQDAAAAAAYERALDIYSARLDPDSRQETMAADALRRTLDVLHQRAAPAALRPAHWVERGAALGRKGRHAEAQQVFAEGLARFPGDVVLLFNLAVAALKAGDYQTALTSSEELLRQVPGHEQARRIAAEAGRRLAKQE
jgi:4-amino-4-deoxy-L-arabinose transferase-like glycosyltransferase